MEQNLFTTIHFKMKVKLISHCTDFNHLGYLQFKRSLDHFKWDYEFLNERYEMYGSKMISAYNYAKRTDCTHLFICDAYDMFVLSTMKDAIRMIKDTDCILFNAEKACWPYSEWGKEYPIVNGPWKYINGGAAFVEVKRFIQLFEENPMKHTDNDQVNLARIYLDKRDRYNMKLDTDCRLFQSIAFEHPGDHHYVFPEYEKIPDMPGFMVNSINKTMPIIIHGNGKTNMSNVYKLL